MTFKQLTLDEAESLAKSNPNVWWDGWDLVMWKRNPSGFMRKAGLQVFRNGTAEWGLATVVSPNDKGLYSVRL